MRVQVERNPDLKFEIVALGITHPDWSAREILAVLKKNDKFKQGLPAIRTIQYILKGNLGGKRNRVKLKNIRQHIDSQWSLGALEEYDIPIETIPLLLQIQAKHPDISIRQAKWIARLSTVVHDPIELWVAAYIYASKEQICEIARIEPLDTSDLDAGLMKRQINIELGNGFSIAMTPKVYDYWFSWIMMGDYVKEEDKKLIGETLAHWMEKDLVGHVLETMNESPIPDGGAWMLYAEKIVELYDKKRGEWNKLSQKKKEDLVNRLRKSIFSPMTGGARAIDLPG